jgi:hypothetical protein
LENTAKRRETSASMSKRIIRNESSLLLFPLMLSVFFKLIANNIMTAKWEI